MYPKQTQTEWENEMSVKVIDLIRSELYLDLRYLGVALSALVPKADASLHTFATDGVYLYYSSAQALRVFQNNPKFLTRAYLHSILHCIFSHLWLAGKRDPMLWNLACDLAVEYTIDHIKKPSTTRILSWPRCQIYQKLTDKQIPISAPSIYSMLAEFNDDILSSLYTEFYTDDHRYWQTEEKAAPIRQTAKKQWDKIARQAALQQAQQNGESEEGRQLFATQIRAERSRRSYRDFLKKFAVLREELHINPDEFDFHFYLYGLQLYGNMPLIEPVETREIKKIQEFVIVIDTSESTSGSLVKNFLRETFEILHQREHFFTICNIRILQCDNEVRSDQVITDLSQFERFLNQFTIIGGGGTNFCPAFTYVNQLIEQQAFQNLSGLLYFTDGQGTYPKKRPPYQTAFLFLEDYEKSSVPPWAIRLRLEPEEFITGGNKKHL